MISRRSLFVGLAGASFLAGSPKAKAARFDLYDSLLFVGKPDLSHYGFKRSRTVYENELWPPKRSAILPFCGRFQKPTKTQPPACVEPPISRAMNGGRVVDQSLMDNSPLPTAVVCRGRGCLLCRPRPRRAATCLCPFRQSTRAI